nr:MAG TPA: hypothetical protein [Caudoviricetes sp.]DAN25714.1 MAG TPA: hypothetical protein [Bacteriophage sp.]
MLFLSSEIYCTILLISLQKESITLSDTTSNERLLSKEIGQIFSIFSSKELL